MDLLFPTLLGAIFGRCRCRSFATAGHRGGPAGRGCSRRRWFPEFSQRDPILPGHIVAHTLESESPFVGHGLPPVFLGELALPGLHLGVGHAFRNPPEPHTVWVELHPLGLAEVPGARLDRLSVLAVTGRAIEDRKSTRLNSSHGSISYAVFCLKKKKKKQIKSKNIINMKKKYNT